MEWLTSLLKPSGEQVAEVEFLVRRTDEVRAEKASAHRKLAKANEQAEVLQAMDRRNHYSESLTEAMRGRTP